MNTTHLKFSKEHKIIKEVIIEGGKIALKWFNNKPNVWKKEDGTDVSEADIEIDNFLQAELRERIPHTGWLSEENKDDYSRFNYDKTLIVDPIDGTKDYIKKSTIMTQTFEYVIKKIKKKIDLLDIDVEGYEYDVLKKINFKKHIFKIILIEIVKFNKVSNKNAKKINILLLKNGYKYIKNMGETSIYKHKSFK